MSVAYNLSERLVIDHDGAICEITNMHDRDGGDTDDPNAARAVVAKRPDGGWINVLVNEPDDSPSTTA